MRYIIYARKSTEEDDRQILSIEAQIAELKEFAAKEKLEIVASFEESKTAKEPGRMKFAEMLSLIESGKAEGILSWNPDRLARNSVDGGNIIHMIDRGLIKALKFPTFWFEPTPQGLFMLQIAFGQSKYYVDNLRENVTRGLRQKIRNGVWPCKAPIGYLNNFKTRGIDADQEKASKIKKLFEMYSTGDYTLKEIAEWCNKINLKSNLERNTCISQVQSILQNIFYVGLMKYKREIHEATHEPMISKKLFEKCQEVMQNRGRVQEVRKNEFAFLGLMKCASCGASITAEIQKGNNYYRCTKKMGVCSEKHYIREEELAEQMKSFIQKVSLSSQDTDWVLGELDKDEQKAREQSKTFVQNLKTELQQIEKQLEKLLDAFLGEIITSQEYAPRKEKLLNKKLELVEKINDFEQKGASWLEPAREFVLSLNKADKILKNGNKKEMTTFLKNIGSNHILENRQFNFLAKIPYDLVAEGGAATKNFLPFPEKWAWEDSNLRPLHYQCNALTT